MQEPGVRGADIIARTLARLGVDRVFSLSGNHIMPLYDALIDTPIDIIHVRHEAACVHMADAYARVTGQVGIAMVTGGQGHTNGAAALFTSLASEAPMILLSGHAGLDELGTGAFQELRQAEMASPVTKASWTVQSTSELGHDLAKAMQIARSGRPGPVHISLPFDLLEQKVDHSSDLWPHESAADPVRTPLSTREAEQIMSEIGAARRPLILCGPTLCSLRGHALMARLEQLMQAPVIGMESPRGINDPSLGAFAEILAQADLIVLLGKPLDFTLKFANAPFVDRGCRFIVIDPDQDLIARAFKYKKERVILAMQADSMGAIEALLTCAETFAGTYARTYARTYAGTYAGTYPGQVSPRSREWLDDVQAALIFRPPQWQNLQSASGGPVHPLELCRLLQSFFTQHPEATLVCDGGEIGQWPQAVVTAAKKRLINGVAGSIGPSLPFALAAKMANPAFPVVAVMGDGTFGFHMAEFDTAVRYGLPVIVIVGNDAKWNAEYQIQVRNYGEPRARGCELLPARYDKVAEALGGHGEYVTRSSELPDALERAFKSGKPACINVLIESVPSPTVKR